MLQPSTALASIVRQAGLEDLADAITIDQSACIAEIHTQARCDELAAASEREQMLADVAAIGFDLFVAALVGRIAVTFVGLVGRPLARRRTKMRQSRHDCHLPEGGLLDG
ncbi:hypothetical protein [Novosphingobium sp. HII-3]|uniref:hypothetical protein n=1 Tax=Novosphingobium sp. HII-3 TaxID=2075565 RepID=UPI0011AF5219|nr:hypothetical protein [Novosphingobium sp. HII-3]